MKKLIIFFLTISISCLSIAGTPIEKQKGRAKAVKKLMLTLTDRQMIGQLFMIDSYAVWDTNAMKKTLYQIDSNGIGGVCFFKGTAQDLLRMNRVYNSHAKVPLFVAIDGEYGLNMRLTDMPNVPMAMTLGALNKKDYTLVYDMGENIAQQCKALGININFAPDIDVNINPNNPVINMRSFGQDKYKVSMLATEYMLGMQDQNVMATIKHFPGHGDTQTDSHKATPIITHSKEFIDSVDTYPFRYTIEKNAWGVMVGHLQVDALTTDSTAPASINKDIITDYLVKDLNFEGLVFTDAMNMKGLTSRYGHGEAEVRALEAGVDVILMPENIDTAIAAIEQAIASGRLSHKFIKDKCRKILQWKYDMGLIRDDIRFSMPEKNIMERADEINAQLYDAALTSVRNSDYIYSDDDKDTIVFLEIGSTIYDTLENKVKAEKNIITKRLNSRTTQKEYDSIFASLPKHKKVYTLVSGGKFAKSSTYYGVPNGTFSILKKIGENITDKSVLVMFANAYALRYIDDTYNYNDIVFAYENNNYTQNSVAKAILGEIVPKGTLPVTANKEQIVENIQNEEKSIEQNIDFAHLKDMGIHVEAIKSIDSIANEGIKQKAYPGCQIIIAQDSNILLDKSYGYYTYDSIKPVNSNTIYDLASVTKVMATTLAVMKLYESGQINLDAEIRKYVPTYKHSKFGKLTIKELLSHYTILPATYFFWPETMKGGKPNPNWYDYNVMMDENYMAVTDSLFIKRSYLKEMQKDLKKAKLTEKKYTYSDLNFLLLQYMVENVSGKTLDQYVDEQFYSKMNLKNTCFNPIEKGISKEDIAPTENDTIFRHQQIQGTVHDPMAAISGGVCGNAGLFSNSHDILKICRMLLNGGKLDGVRYLDENTIETFNTRYFAKQNIRRALGFDKPFISSASTHCSKYASQSSFGHSGFTGTYFWIDPDNGTIFIFLSNRVYPYSSPNKLSKLNIRTDINDLIYKALER